MENPSCNGLKYPAGSGLVMSLASWRGELLAQHGLTPDERRELECHLLDAIDAHQSNGMDDGEAFARAREGLGPLAELSREFAAADPARQWRGRAFWMAIGLLCNNAWSMAVANFIVPLLKSQPPAYASLVFYIPLLGLATALALGFKIPGAPALRPIFKTRTRFILIAALVIQPLHWRSAAWMFASASRHWIFIQAFLTALWNLSLIALAAWLLPAQPRKPAPAPAWRERIFWMTLALLVQILWLNTGVASANAIIVHGIQPLAPNLYSTPFSLPGLIVNHLLYILFAYLPPLALAALLATGRAAGPACLLGRAFHSRTRLAIAAAAALCAWRAWYLASYSHDFAFANWCTIAWNFPFVALVAWLMPARSKAPGTR
ncbi:MAG TPA: permease prefix domain 1-containing protein [Chthoniobacteraceae bacterium]|nr:permease prefix domain 1-containing protein [Chthoniobacteraceae bacterium]